MPKKCEEIWKMWTVRKIEGKNYCILQSILTRQRKLHPVIIPLNKKTKLIVFILFISPHIRPCLVHFAFCIFGKESITFEVLNVD